ncbi:MAG TPA: ribosome biogenesis factor YjgA [Steroidobacteraceae bacterium]|nr:ribosome biogenesis factor YjgA [Steroidobacteraceae bacterium]
MTAGPDDDPGDDGGTERPSKSARKRAAHAAQDLGEALVRLSDAELSALELPEALREALRAARRIASRAALARQRQYIGKLMRQVDPEPIRAALAARGERHARDTERFRRIENWRERLVTEGEAALAELSRWHPEIDVGEWRQLVGAARAERERGGGAVAASRELFRALRALLATMPP